jgi:hypothetical protein
MFTHILFFGVADKDLPQPISHSLMLVIKRALVLDAALLYSSGVCLNQLRLAVEEAETLLTASLKSCVGPQTATRLCRTYNRGIFVNIEHKVCVLITISSTDK